MAAAPVRPFNTPPARPTQSNEVACVAGSEGTSEGQCLSLPRSELSQQFNRQQQQLDEQGPSHPASTLRPNDNEF